MSEPTLLTCGICGLVPIDHRIHHLTDCIDALRASLSTAEKERAALEKQLSKVTDIRDLVIRWHNTHNSTTTDHACGFCALLDELEAAFDHALGPASAEDAALAATKTPDSSALEKALGALRAALNEGEIGLLAHSEKYVPINVIASWFNHFRTAFSGGAHVDGPKAQKEEEK